MDSTTLVSASLEKKLSELLHHDGKIGEAARYAVFSGGKRIRPKMALAAAALFSVPYEIAALPACALELIHTYSLIHDDLPCMDNDDFRRGKPTLHKVYDEALALLTGDFLLTYAFELLAHAPGLSDHQKLRLISILSQKSGAHGMIGGQELDITRSALTEETILQMHLRKTAALFTAAMEFGGVLANQSDLSLLAELGQNFGLFFQINDDLADGDGITRILGHAETEKLSVHYHQKLLASLKVFQTPEFEYNSLKSMIYTYVTTKKSV